MKTESDDNKITYKTGLYSSLFMAVITIVTFGFAITAVPISGVFCAAGCIEYPYLDTLSQYPKDYLWMFLAILLILAYQVFMVSVHSFASGENKIFSRIGLTFSIISSVVLLACYFIQFAVIPASLINGETEGIALLTQYNPHGVFIALEELGYLMMSLSFLFLAPAFTGKNRLEKFIRGVFVMAFILTIISFVTVTFKYGINREYRFEIVVISIDWLVLFVNGILAGIFFKRTMKQIKNE